MISRQFLLNRIGSTYAGRKDLLVYDQSTGDIIQAILDADQKYSDQYKNISSYFKGYNDEETGRKIFDFLKRHIKYIVESEDQQLVKSPAAILHTGVSDCKCYSLFGSGILKQLGVNYCFRFASYRSNDKNPGHVFIVINPGTNNEIWLDPVLSYYNYKKAYCYKIDKKPRKMAIYQISGIGASAEKKARRKARRKAFGQKLKKGVKGVLKVAAAPARNAFLGLVALNVHGLGTKVMQLYAKDLDKLKNFWGSAGGQINKLLAAAQKGSKKKRILGTDPNPNIIGVAIPTLLTTASPIIVAFAKMLKSAGIDPKELVQVGKMALNKKAQELISEQTTEEEKAIEANEEAAMIDYDNI